METDKKDIDALPHWKRTQVRKHINRVERLRQRHQHWLDVCKKLKVNIKSSSLPSQKAIAKVQKAHPSFTESQSKYYIQHSLRHKLSSRLYNLTHKHQQKIYRGRSYMRKFISDMADNEQLDAVETWIHDRKNILEGK